MEKPWRLHLANSAIHHLDIVSGDPSLVAVWTRDGQVACYDLERGAAHGAASFTLPDSPEQWWPLLDTIKDPKGRKLPYARIGGMSVWLLPNGKVMTYHGRARIEIGDRSDAPPVTLTFDVTPSAIAVDTETQLVAALDSKGALLLGKPGGTVKTIKPGLIPNDELPLSVVIARGGKRIVVSDGTHLAVLDSGKVSAQRELHYSCGLLALSPDGQHLLTFDSDSGVLRAYVPADLRLTHQRFVIDLLSSAEELQLIGFAELPPVSAAVSALAIENSGRFAFAVFGQVCAAAMNHLSSTEGAPNGGKATVTRAKSDMSLEAPKAVERPIAKPTPVMGGTERASGPRLKPAAPSTDTAPIEKAPPAKPSSS